MKITKLDESFNLDQLNEDLLVEGPIDWIKDKFSKKPVDQKEADRIAKEKEDKKIQKRRETKDPKFLSKDFESQNSKSTFYIDNNYDKPMTQDQFRKWLETKQQKIDNMPVETPEQEQKQQKEQQKLDAQRYNAIVVSEHGYYMRRGAEPLTSRYLSFVPGENDEIRNGYFIQPYKYKKTNVASSNKSGNNGAKDFSKQDISKFMTICETTGMVIVDADGKSLNMSDIRKIKLSEINNYKVKLGNVNVPILDWITKAKSKKLI